MTRRKPHDVRPDGDLLPEGRRLIPRRLLELLEREPALKAPVLVLGKAVTERLDSRTCEVVALAASAARGCLYVWLAHVLLALDEGLTLEDIARIAAGPAACDARDTAILRAVDDLLGGRALDASTRHQLGPDALAVTIAIGFYGLVTALTLGLEPEPDARPVPGFETPARASEMAA